MRCRSGLQCLLAAVAIAAAGVACSGSKEGSVRISWDPNHEAAVNTPGGGYRVYISEQADFDPASVTPRVVPYTETSTNLHSWRAGTYYVRVEAFTADGRSSAISPAARIEVPEK